MIKIALIGIITATLILLIGQYQKGIAVILLLAGSLSIFLFCTSYLKQGMDLVISIREWMKIDPLYGKILLKIVGIAYISQFSSDICKDLGSQSLGKQIESAGKIAVLLIGIPVIQGVFDTMKELLLL